MQELFGKDMVNRILIMATFSDAAKPNCIEALKAAGIAYTKLFQFNNSAIFASRNDSDALFMTKKFWSMGMSSFENFLKNCHSDVISISQTAEVIKVREKLENSIIMAQERIEEQNAKFRSLQSLMEQIVKLKSIEESTKNYEVTFDEEFNVKEDISGKGIHTTTCLTCNFTCHNGCVYANDADKQKCCAMADGLCTQCPKKCSWDMHSNLPHIFKRQFRKSKRTVEDLKKQYCSAQAEGTVKEQVFNGIKEELKQLLHMIFNDMKIVQSCLTELGNIALKPTNFEALDYIKNMIHAEKDQHLPGWETRVSQLQNMQKKMESAQMFASKSQSITLDQFEGEYMNEIDKMRLPNANNATAVSTMTKKVKDACLIF